MSKKDSSYTFASKGRYYTIKVHIEMTEVTKTMNKITEPYSLILPYIIRIIIVITVISNITCIGCLAGHVY